MPLHFVISQRGNQQLIYNGFVFRKERISLNKSIWKCIENYKCHNGCRCHTSENEVIFHSANHNHVPNKAEASTDF